MVQTISGEIVRDATLPLAAVELQAANTLTGNGAGSPASPTALSVNDARTLLAVNLTDNTSDLDKPISTATQTALDGKAYAEDFLTVAALRAGGAPLLPPGRTTVASTSYHTYEGKGGARFRWQGNSNTADNNGTVIKPTAVVGAGRWIWIQEAPVTPYIFGAPGDGVLSDAAAWQATIDAFKTVRIPNSTWYIDGLVTAIGDRHIYGDSIAGVQIIVDTPSFLHITDGPNYARALIENLSILANRVPATDTYGIYHDMSNLSPLRNALIARNIVFRDNSGAITGTHGFHKYIWTNNTYAGAAIDCRIEGTYNWATDPATQFACSGIFNGGQTIGFEVLHSNFNNIYYHTYVDVNSEGLQHKSCEAVGVNKGIYAPNSVKPGLWIEDFHANAVEAGVDITGRSDSRINGGSMYSSAGFFDKDFVGVLLTNTNIVKMSAVTCIDGLTGRTSNSTGISLIGTCFDTSASDVSLKGLKQGIITNGAGNNGANFSHVGFQAVVAGFAVGTNDINITLGEHEFIGSNTTRYAISANTNTIRIWTPELRHNRIQVTNSIGAAGTLTLSPRVNRQVYRLAYAAGGGAYTHFVDLLPTNALEGDHFIITVSMPSSVNPTVTFRNGSAGPTLTTLNTAIAQKWFIWAEYDSTGNWILINQSLSVV